ncbi:hypothetical protein GCM10027399_24600 [Curvibacter fontanus]|jgi:hypothetical protein
MQYIDELFKAIGAVAAIGGGVVAIAYAIFRKFGEKWLDTKFEERLAAYRHSQQKELEQLRFQINALLDRATKLHQREFEVMPEAWAKLNDAYWKVSAFVSPMQSYPGLDAMSDAQLEEFVSACDLNEWEKTELLEAEKKTDYYIEHIFWHRLHEAKSLAREAHVFIAKNGIFLPPEIKSQFVAVDALVWDALDEHEQNERYKAIPRDSKKQQALRTDAPEKIKSLEKVVQGRLWNSQHEAL